MASSVKLALLSIGLTSAFFAQSDKTPSPATPVPNSSSSKNAESGDSTRLVLSHFVQPVYPLEAMQQKLQGHVVIHLVISTSGEVLSADPVSGNPILTQAAVAAMKQWKFEPYMHGGHAVQIGYKMPYDFAMATQVHDHPDPDAGTPASDAGAPGTAVAPASSSSSQATAAPTRIAGTQAQQLILHQVAPIYPDIARQRFIQGTVVLQAIIGQDGRVKNLRPVSGPKELYDSAVGAVEQWRYKPFVLDGKPVEVETTINVNYKLTQ